MQALGLVKRSLSQLDKHSFVVMYNTYVRPHLEYCAQAWNLHPFGISTKASNEIGERS